MSVKDREGSLRVTLDVTAVPERPAGAGRYTIELARALLELSDVMPELVCRSDDRSRWRGLGTWPLHPVSPSMRPLRLAWEQARLPSLLRGWHPDVHHGPHYTMPERSEVPIVVTVHDCTFFDHPEWHQRLKVPFFRRAIRVAGKRAGAVVCVSRTTAEVFSQFVDVRCPIVVAPHGIDHHRFSPEQDLEHPDQDLLRGLGIKPETQFVVFIGTMEPRKGVATLIRAFDRIAARHPDTTLVLAGQDGWNMEVVARALAEAVHNDQIRRLGYVPDEAVPALLRQATVVAYPSLAEGYGLPALEAMACGAPLITTIGTAMAELAGPSALLVPSADETSLAGALDTVLSSSDSPGLAERRRLGLARAAEHTWAVSAARHLDAYRQAVG